MINSINIGLFLAPSDPHYELPQVASKDYLKSDEPWRIMEGSKPTWEYHIPFPPSKSVNSVSGHVPGPEAEVAHIFS